MRKAKVILLLGYFIFTINLFAQSERELAMVQTLENLNSNVVKATTNPILAPSISDRYQLILKENKDDRHLSAEANALIGNDLSAKGYHKIAVDFLKKAYALRKKEGNYLPQRWALNSLLMNSLKLNDFKSSLKYAKAWLKLTDQFVGTKRALTGTVIETSEFRETYNIILNKIYPYYRRVNDEKRIACANDFVKYVAKKYPNYKVGFALDDAEEFYSRVIASAITSGKKEVVKYWFTQAKKVAKKKKRVDMNWYADLLRISAAKCKKEEGGGAQKRGDHEPLGIELMETYIKVCKKIKDYDQVLFGSRYIATRYREIKDYKKATQYLATAIKYCHQYNMPDEIDKSIGGMESMMYNVRKIIGKVGVREAVDWKENYSLKGLKPEDITAFDRIIEYNLRR